jgi:hypothetical protein
MEHLRYSVSQDLRVEKYATVTDAIEDAFKSRDWTLNDKLICGYCCDINDDNCRGESTLAIAAADKYPGTAHTIFNRNNVTVMVTSVSVLVKISGPLDYGHNIIMRVLQLLNYNPYRYAFANGVSYDTFLNLLPDKLQKCFLKYDRTWPIDHRRVLVTPNMPLARPIDHRRVLVTPNMPLAMPDSFYEFLLCLKECDTNNAICDDIIRKIYQHTFDI